MNDVHLTVGESDLVELGLPFVFNAWLTARVKLLRSTTRSECLGDLAHRGQVPGLASAPPVMGRPFLPDSGTQTFALV